MTRIVRRTLLKTLSVISLGSLLPFMGHTSTIDEKPDNKMETLNLKMKQLLPNKN